MSDNRISIVKTRNGETPKEAFYRWMSENNYEMKILVESEDSEDMVGLVIVDGNDEIVATIE